MTNVYVGNLLYATTEAELVEFFSQWGAVERATLVFDRETGRPRGFAFVEMVDAAEAAKAIAAAHGAELNGRPLTVNEARPRGSGQQNRSQSAIQPRSDAPTGGGYGNAGHSAPQAPPAEHLPQDDPGKPAPPETSDEPLRRSGGYTNHLQR